MSDSLHHECGIALLRLLKPLEFYQAKYGTPLFIVEDTSNDAETTQPRAGWRRACKSQT